MPHAPQTKYMPDERILDVAPRFDRTVGDPTPRRVNYVAGRSLTAADLDLEQTAWDRRITLLSRAVNPGILHGLEVELLSDGADAELRVLPGAGITAEGEDVVLNRTLNTRIVDIPPVEALLEDDVSRPIGLVGLFLAPARAVTANNFDPEDPCPIDPEQHVFDDLVTQDSAALVWASVFDAAPVGRPNNEQLLRAERVEELAVHIRKKGRFAKGLSASAKLSTGFVTLPPNTIIGRDTSVDVPTSIHRNIVTKNIFEEAQSFVQRGQNLPWDRYGVPLALAEIDEDGRVVFIDRFALARMGGAVRKANPVSVFGQSETIRRARFEQFVDHIQALRAEGAPLEPASDYFRYLPPVGVLPASLMQTTFLPDELRVSSGFFPDHFSIEAAPIQLTQMESILAARSGLEMYDLSKPDYVQLLVPVPDHLYDPNLLTKALISPKFQDSIDDAEERENTARWDLHELEGASPEILGLVSFEDVDLLAFKSHEDTEADPFVESAASILAEVNKAARSVPVSAEEAAQINEEAYIVLSDELVSIANTPVADADPKTEKEKVKKRAKDFDLAKEESEFKGLKHFLGELEGKVSKANDAIDMSFLRLQSDIYRLRKQMDDEGNTTRLATSPILANLSIKNSAIETTKIFASFLGGAQNAEKSDQQKSGGETTASSTSTSGNSMKMTTFMTSAISPMSVKYGAVQPYIAAKAAPMVKVQDFGKSAPILPTKSFTPTTVKASLPPVRGISGLKADVKSNLVKSSDVALQGLIYGKAAPVRTATIAERLRPSAAQEAKNAAVATKAEAIRSAQELGINLTGLQVPVSASRLTLVATDRFTQVLNRIPSSLSAVRTILQDETVVPEDDGFVILDDRAVLVHTLTEHPINANASATNKNIYRQMKVTLRDLYAERITLEHENLAGLILSDLLDPDPQDGDEGAFFAAAVDALESAVSMLRLVEGRTQSYANFIEALRKQLVVAIDNIEAWEDGKDVLKADIAEAIHDANAARALMAEEQERLDRINAKRRDILEKHVDIVAFARPMFANRLQAAPGMGLYGPIAEVIPTCLGSDEDLPEEIEEILEAMRDAPLGWYPALAKLLAELRKPYHYLRAWQRAHDRAQLWLSRYGNKQRVLQRHVHHRRVSGKSATGVHRALSAVWGQRRGILQHRLRRDLNSLQGVSWSSLKLLANDEISIEDVADAGKPGRDIADQGNTLINEIGEVAGCYLGGLREVPATIRLIWADQLSEHDDAIDLTDPTAIPGWGGISFAQRRELEHLHRWLFARIDTKNESARAMMSTLVRVCLLMSSHAPVSSIVEGTVSETKTVSKGESIEVDITLGAPSIGMIARFATDKGVTHGVVEDLVGSRVRISITEQSAKSRSVDANTVFHFTAPGNARLAKLETT